MKAPTGPQGSGGDVFGLHDRQGSPGGHGGQGLAAEGGGMVAGPERVGYLGAGPAGPDWHAIAEGFGHGDHVGDHVEVLVGEP